MRTRLLPETFCIRAVPRRDHRRLWSRRGMARIKIGSVPIFYGLEHRVNIYVPVLLDLLRGSTILFPVICPCVHAYSALLPYDNGGKSRKGAEDEIENKSDPKGRLG